GQRAVHGLRLGHGPAPVRRAAAVHPRDPGAVGVRRALPRAVRARRAAIGLRGGLAAGPGRSPHAARVAARRAGDVAAVLARTPPPAPARPIHPPSATTSSRSTPPPIAPTCCATTGWRVNWRQCWVARSTCRL